MSGSLISHQYVENSPGSQEKNGSSSSQEKDDYSVNPNQKVYDTPHQLDHEVNVVKIYFAEQKPKMNWESKEEPYTVQSINGATAKAIKHKKEDDLKKLKKEIKNIQVLDSVDDTKVLSDITKLKKGESVKIKWEENVRQKDAEGKPDFEYSQINKISIKKKVWIVANCEGTTGKLTIQINENKLENEDQIYENPIKFLIGQEEKDKIEFDIKGLSVYNQEITLQPKSEEDSKKILEKFKKRIDKGALVYFKAEVTETEDEKKFPDDTHEFLNRDGELFTIFLRAPWMEYVLEEAKIYGGYSEGGETMLDKRIKSTYFAIKNEFANSKSDPHKVSWCAAFASWCLQQAGYANPSTCRALEFSTEYVFEGAGHPDKKLSHMRKIIEPVYGCIVVWKNNSAGGGHVAFYYGKNKEGHIIPLGGNQGSSLQFSDRNPSGDYKQTVVGYFLPEDYPDNSFDKFTTEELLLDAHGLNSSGLLAKNGFVSGET